MELHGTDADDQAQPAQKILQIGPGVLSRLPAPLRLHHLRAIPVFRGHRGLVKGPDQGQPFLNPPQIFGHGQRQHVRGVGHDLGALGGVIVQKDETVESQLEFRGQGAQIG